MKKSILFVLIRLLVVILLSLSSHLSASELAKNTAACRMEVKILGYEALEEDKDCIWLVENTALVMEKCPECLLDLKLIKEAAQGYFDY